jgi:hypothetical protein
MKRHKLTVIETRNESKRLNRKNSDILALTEHKTMGGDEYMVQYKKKLFINLKTRTEFKPMRLRKFPE